MLHNILVNSSIGHLVRSVSLGGSIVGKINSCLDSQGLSKPREVFNFSSYVFPSYDSEILKITFGPGRCGLNDVSHAVG